MRLAYSVGVMKLLHHRATRHFIALLIECRCGKKFLHRLDRPVIACLHCGRTDDLGRIIEKLRDGPRGRAGQGTEGGASRTNSRRLTPDPRVARVDLAPRPWPP